MALPATKTVSSSSKASSCTTLVAAARRTPLRVVASAHKSEQHAPRPSQPVERPASSFQEFRKRIQPLAVTVEPEPQASTQSSMDFLMAPMQQLPALLGGFALALALQLNTIPYVRNENAARHEVSVATADVSALPSMSPRSYAGAAPHPRQPTVFERHAAQQAHDGKIAEAHPIATGAQPQPSPAQQQQPGAAATVSRSHSHASSAPPFAGALAQLRSVDEWQQATAASASQGRLLATILTSAAVAKAHGAALDSLVRHYRAAGVDFAVVVASADDVAPHAEGAQAALVRRLKSDGRLVFPSLAVTGGKGGARHMRAAGIASFRQTLADAAHRNAHGVKGAAVPLVEYGM